MSCIWINFLVNELIIKLSNNKESNNALKAIVNEINKIDTNNTGRRGSISSRRGSFVEKKLSSTDYDKSKPLFSSKNLVDIVKIITSVKSIIVRHNCIKLLWKISFRII